APPVLDHSRARPQGDPRHWPARHRRPVGRLRHLEVVHASDMLDNAVAGVVIFGVGCSWRGTRFFFCSTTAAFSVGSASSLSLSLSLSLSMYLVRSESNQEALRRLSATKSLFASLVGRLNFNRRMASIRSSSRM